MTTGPKDACKLTKQQRDAWALVFDEFMRRLPQESKFSHVTAGDIADRVVDVLSANKPRECR